MPLRSNNEHALAVGDRCHCLHTIDSKIDDHLLQLDPISAHQEQARRGLEPHRDAMPTRLVPHEADCLLDDLVDVQLDHLRVGLFGEVTNPADHLT
jgi:hypothetical protein